MSRVRVENQTKNTPVISRSPSFNIGLRTFTTGALLILSISIALLFIADSFYVQGASVIEMFTSPDIRSAIALSLVTSVLATLISVIIAIPSAYALSRFYFPGRIVLDILIDLLLVIPVLVVGVSILVVFRFGVVFSESPIAFVKVLGMLITFLGDIFIYQKSGIILTQFFCSVPFAVRVIKSSFDTIDQRTEKVAQTLGCTAFSAFVNISLPMASKGILAGTILTWARAFGLFGPVSLVAGAVRQKTEVLPTAIFLEISIGRIEIALAMSLLMIVLAFGILLAVRLLTRSSVYSSGSSA